MTRGIETLASDLRERAHGQDRFIIAIAGPPGAGKSTFSDALFAALDRREPGSAVVVPMDGYHFDNIVLGERGLLARKGAPETFNVSGLACDLGRIRAGGGEVAVPVFDRALDLARGNARFVRPAHRLVLVEGNYLLLDAPPWNALAPLFDLTLMLRVPEAELRRRLVERWLTHGLDASAALTRAEENDIANAHLVLAGSRPADIAWG